ncbi:MAG: hypothetical protein JOZ10_05610 [Acidobacteria bacterium]|nr:hypothetical protein [Acidobacteriota bacterium]MBV9144403.1 hypothetical protein [Acidobacteriota bacterium]
MSASAVFAVEPAVPSSVDVYWKSTRSISAPGVSSVVVLDDEIAHAQIGNETIEFAGLSRGSTVVLAFVNGNPVSIVVNVIERPMAVIPPSLLRKESELAHGTYGSDFQMSSAGGVSNFVLLNSFTWAQQMGDHRLEVNSQIEDNTAFGGHSANLRTGGVIYRTPHTVLNAVDFNESLSGAVPDDHINNFSSPSVVELRGAGITLDRGRNEYSIFAGTTLPYYFLSLNATRDVAGFTFHRKETDKLNLFGGLNYASIPLALDSGIERRNYVMQSAGFSYKLTKNLLIGGQGGYSNAGGLARFDASYTSFRFSAYASAIRASQTFPLNQLQSLFSGTSSIRGGLSYRTTLRLTQGFYFEHSTITPGLIYRFSGSSDYLSPTLGYHFSPGETLNFNYTYSRNIGGFSPAATTGNRYDVSVNSQLGSRISNTAQATIGSIQDPLQINSEDQFSVRDAVSVPIKGQTFMFGVEHDRTQPSLLSKLNNELTLLSPALQTQFLANPAAFIDSSNFPPEIKALLAAEQPSGTTFSASGNISVGSKLRLSPNVSLTYTGNGVNAESWTNSFGYSLVYLLRPTFQFRSSLTNVLLWNGQQNSMQRTWILSAGFQKNFSATPGGLPLLHRSRMIEGRVFRDNNINGAFNNGEPGLEGIEVRLDNGEVTTTDTDGRYKFNSVSADQHQVSVDLMQFKEPVRMTTPSEASVDVIQKHIAVADFGILDFARVMGTVYNDLRFDNRRQPDSKGVQGIEVLLDNGKNVRRMQTAGAGDFELDNVPPGDYKLSIEANSLPANYAAPGEAVPIHVSPVATVVQEIPLRALRSISGQVLLRVENPPRQTQNLQPGVSNAALKNKTRGEKQQAASDSASDQQSYKFVPLAGVRIKAADSTAQTDEAGNFLIRNLPAGRVSVGLIPVQAVPEGMKLPSGELTLPAEPIQVQGASVVITNADLVPYLTDQPVPDEPTAAPRKAPILQGKRQSAPAPKDAYTVAKLGPPQLPFAKPAPAPALPSPDRVLPAPPSSVPVSALPVSSAKASLPQVSVAAPLAAVTTPPRAPVCSVEQVAAARAGGQSIDCDHDFDSLGELARCYRARRAARHAQGIP